VLSFGACGGDGDEDSDDSIVISAASSLTEPLEAYGETTETEEQYSFAGSDDLAAQIRKGAPVDVFASANTSLPVALFDEGLVEEPEIFISNQLVLAVPKNGVLLSETLPDTAPFRLLPDVSDIDVVIAAEGVPVGDYTREVLSKLSDGDEGSILSRVRSEEPDVKSIVGKLVTGAADAGFVYASDVNAAGGELIAIELPKEVDPIVTYAVAVVADTENPEGAQEYIDSLVDGEAHEFLLDAEFLEPPQEK